MEEKRDPQRRFKVAVGAAVAMFILSMVLLGSYKGRQGNYDSALQVKDELAAEVAQLKDEVKNLERENQGLASKSLNYENAIEKLEEDAENDKFFLHCIIGVVCEADNTFYHTPDCSILRDGGNFNVLISKTCSEYGLKPCPLCHDDKDLQAIEALIASADTPSVTEYTNKSEEESETVYITDTGEKYHRWGCQYLRQSCYSISLQNALSQGYTACSRCW